MTDPARKALALEEAKAVARRAFLGDGRNTWDKFTARDFKFSLLHHLSDKWKEDIYICSFKVYSRSTGMNARYEGCDKVKEARHRIFRSTAEMGVRVFIPVFIKEHEQPLTNYLNFSTVDEPDGYKHITGNNGYIQDTSFGPPVFFLKNDRTVAIKARNNKDILDMVVELSKRRNENRNYDQHLDVSPFGKFTFPLEQYTGRGRWTSSEYEYLFRE